MGSLQPQRGVPLRVGVEKDSVPPQTGDVPHCFRAKDPHGFEVVQTRTCCQRVGDMRIHGVAGGGFAGLQHGRHAALGVEGVAVLQLPLAQQDNVRRGAPFGVGRQQRCVEPGNPAAHHHEAAALRRIFERALAGRTGRGHGRAASIRSRATRAGAATSSSTVMRFRVSPLTSASSTQAR